MVNKPASEHLAFCKARALEYLEVGEVNEAWSSFLSDMKKNETTAHHDGIMMGMMLVANGHLDTAEKMRRFIEGF